MFNGRPYKKNHFPGKRLFQILVNACVAGALVFALSGGNPIHASAASTWVVMAGTGDISTCSNAWDSKTAHILDVLAPSIVFTLGDNVYNSGSASEYKNCYNPTWGVYKSRTKPVPGNHDYNTSGASGYYKYFGVPQYYAYNAGSWRVYALNSEIDTSATSAQAQWLKKDLAANPRKCVMAYWHRSRWSSGSDHGSDSKTQALWSILYDARAEVVLTGHNHNYERFAPMNKSGQAVSTGLQEFVVGSGGMSHDGFGKALPASRARSSNTTGVIRMVLQSDRYSWKYFSYPVGTFEDSGTILCH
jgi:acid phosphatase type 7